MKRITYRVEHRLPGSDGWWTRCGSGSLSFQKAMKEHKDLSATTTARIVRIKTVETVVKGGAK